MTGIRGYELPMTDLLGGIVFEDGPRTRVLPRIAVEASGWQRQRKKSHDERVLQIPVASACEGVWAYLQGWQAFNRTWSRGDREGIACPEIKHYMAQYPELTPADRVDVVSYIHILLYTIEFQKRGLPHCHTLLWVDSKNEMQDTQQIDDCISAEIPDSVQDPSGYKLVIELMMHRPCGAASPSAACMQEGSCSMHFPKTYNNRTFFDSNGHTHYRRRDTGVYVLKGESKLDNCDVVPYNRALCLAFEVHINVEYCVYYDDMHRPHIDEIQNYVDGRFICPYEACWRIFDFPIHSQEPTVQILNVHLENMVASYALTKLRDLQNKLLMEEKIYKRDLLRKKAADAIPKLNHDQRKIFDLIISASTTNQQELLFVHDHGGTGKTFLWRTIISSLRSHGKIGQALRLYFCQQDAQPTPGLSFL
ncbi:DNA helicase [Tanacetum coccineum]|uniref:ATP-dependent DNA helicase n=1 Tax=Tanacetum coccineum TaxID=301880 RepID=A0ABQ5B2H5_9ASTR